MRRFTSVATSPGIAIGQVYRIRRPTAGSFTRLWIQDKDVEREVERFRQAIHLAKENLNRIQSRMCRFQGHDQINIIESYRLFLQDDMLVKASIDSIATNKINAEWALDKTLAHLRLSFLNIHEDYLRERRQDIDYVGRCIMDNLLGHPEIPLQDLPEGDVVLVAHDLSPAEIASLPKDRVKGFVMEVGGETSHTAIISRSLEIPAIFGVVDVTSAVQDGETIIIDGVKGLAIASPGKRELEQYRSIHKRYLDMEKMLLEDINLPAETKDGFRMRLEANVELLEEIPALEQHGAEGVGLYRTEYLFLDRMDEPSEEEQFASYVKVLEQLAPKPVTIRTIDLGADKLSLSQGYDEQANPALGLRGIRLCLREQAMFRRQLKALLRASAFGNLKILLPMVNDVQEIVETRALIDAEKETLREDGIPFTPDIPLGIMVETPAAVLTSEMLAREADFFSIGTNDLIQYGLALDRTNELVSDLYTPFHPAVLRMILKTVESARKAGIPVSMCGEMAGDPLTLILMVGMGLDSLSMNPVSLPRVKKIMRSITRKKAEALMKRVLALTSASEVVDLLKVEIGHLLPSKVQKAILST
jgi:phosphotransferase system enzyme I (PtsI)